MSFEPVTNYYKRDYGCMEPIVREVADPSKAYRCTVTVARMGGRECRVNRLTGDVYDRCRGELTYIGRSTSDDARDAEAWAAWARSMGVA